MMSCFYSFQPAKKMSLRIFPSKADSIVKTTIGLRVIFLIQTQQRSNCYVVLDHSMLLQSSQYTAKNKSSTTQPLKALLGLNQTEI